MQATVQDGLQTVARDWYARVQAAGEAMVTAREVPAEVAATIDSIVDRLTQESLERFLPDTDPYLGQALLTATLVCDKGLRAESDEQARLQVRLGLERLRQALRDLVDETPAADTRPAKAIARWLAEELRVPQRELAVLLRVSPRSLQRWVSTTDPAGPSGDEEARLRAVARVTAHLRHVFTAPGVVRWFQSPHPHLDGGPPSALLDDPLQLPRLARLASLSRSTLAS